MPPFPFKRNPEDAPNRGPGQDPRAQDAQLGTHTLTEELLDWLIASLETVLKTPQLRELAGRRVEQSLRDALKQADHLWPVTEEVRRRTTLWELEHRDTGVTVEAPAERGGAGSVRPG